MPKSRWIHSETVAMIDCLDGRKRAGDWTLEERVNVAKEVQTALGPSKGFPRSTFQILRRIEDLGLRWSTPSRKDAFALYHYGWDALDERCQRANLESHPEAKTIPRKRHTSVLPGLVEAPVPNSSASPTQKPHPRCLRQRKESKYATLVPSYVTYTDGLTRHISTSLRKTSGKSFLHRCMATRVWNLQLPKYDVNGCQYRHHPIPQSLPTSLAPRLKTHSTLYGTQGV